MNINWGLKTELIKRFGSQVAAARVIGIREAKLSYIIRGHAEPSQQEYEALKCILGEKLLSKLLKK